MDLIKHIEENFFAVGRYWGSLNSSLKQAGSVWSMNTGVTISDINWVWNEKPLSNDDAKSITKTKDFYKQLNLRFWWWVFPSGQSPETRRILQGAGLRLMERVPCMAVDLNDSPSDSQFPENIKISEVKDKNDLLTWEEISFHGFEMPSRARKQYGAFVSSFKLGAQSQQKLFIAYLDGLPAATSLLFTYKNSAGIYYVSTLPACRNKGCGMRITQAAMLSAKESGFKDVILQATPLGAKVYRRAEFKEYCHAEIYKL
ncbi:MAG: GNAT family N-acetyltransferase [Smithella sp.]|jgi:ribosomal protein S18 acetylase RimI-like enzyme